jgi:sugar/nucleoside kinase (ribokinase family)
MRTGICGAGSWIIDHVRTVNVWPAEETLADILAEDLGTGGCPYNLCVDVSRFQVGVPVSGIGLIGDDEDGALVLADTDRYGIDARHITRTDAAPTAHTEVIFVKGTGKRTFFHHRGANALLGPQHVPVAELECRIFCLGYLLLLDTLDADDPEYGTAAARVLAGCQAAGIETAVDVVSEDSDRFGRVITPSLPHTDYLIINEIEAGRTTGRTVRRDGVLDEAELHAAACDLLERGVRKLVVLHAPETAIACARDGEPVWRPSLSLPPDFVKGSAGAGDAFLSGMLVGIHEGWPLDESLDFAHAAAASCLRHPTCTGGVGTADEIRQLARELA